MNSTLLNELTESLMDYCFDVEHDKIIHGYKVDVVVTDPKKYGKSAYLAVRESPMLSSGMSGFLNLRDKMKNKMFAVLSPDGASMTATMMAKGGCMPIYTNVDDLCTAVRNYIRR